MYPNIHTHKKTNYKKRLSQGKHKSRQFMTFKPAVQKILKVVKDLSFTQKNAGQYTVHKYNRWTEENRGGINHVQHSKPVNTQYCQDWKNYQLTKQPEQTTIKSNKPSPKVTFSTNGLNIPINTQTLQTGSKNTHQGQEDASMGKSASCTSLNNLSLTPGTHIKTHVWSRS